MSATPIHKLSEVMALKIDAVPVDAAETYRFAGVYSFGRGLFERAPLSGAKTSYKFFHRLHAGDFVISEPKGWEGAIARISKRFDGWFLSPVFPTFRLIDDEVSADYLELFFKQPRVWNALRKGAKGLGARRESVSAVQFLELPVRLPSRTEQKRIVDLLLRLDEARRLNEEVSRELTSLFNSTLAHAFDGQV